MDKPEVTEIYRQVIYDPSQIFNFTDSKETSKDLTLKRRRPFYES